MRPVAETGRMAVEDTASGSTGGLDRKLVTLPADPIACAAISTNYDRKILEDLRKKRDDLFNMLKLAQPEMAKCLEHEFHCLDEHLNNVSDPDETGFAIHSDHVLRRLGFDKRKRNYFCDAMVLTAGVKILQEVNENLWKTPEPTVDRAALAKTITSAIKTTSREFILAAARAELAECDNGRIEKSSEKLRAHRIAMQSMIALYETGSFQDALSTMERSKDLAITKVGSRKSFDSEMNVPLVAREKIDNIISFFEKRLNYKMSDTTDTKADYSFLRELLHLTTISKPALSGEWNLGVGHHFCAIFVFSGLLKE